MPSESRSSEGTIRKRPDGRWEGRILLGYRDGKRVRPSFYGVTRIDVQQALEQARKRFNGGIAVTGKQTLHTFLERWLEDTAKPRLRHRTFTGYEQHVENHVDPLLGHIMLNELTPQHVQQLIRTKTEEGLSARTIGYMRAVLRAALNDAQRWGMVDRNAAALAEVPKSVRHRIQILDTKQAQAFLRAAKRNQVGPLVSVALAVGLRLGEALGLAWEDIDLNKKMLRVRRALQRTKEGLRFVEPKSEQSRRSVSLPAFAVTALERHRALQKKWKFAAGNKWVESGLVFTTSIGTAMDERNVRREFNAILEDAKLPAMRIHDPRHTCASLLLAQGVHPRVVMETLGHSQISITMNTYSHVMPALSVEAAERMNAAMKPTRVGVKSGVKTA
jgi:integrase